MAGMRADPAAVKSLPAARSAVLRAPLARWVRRTTPRRRGAPP
ncbi:hypothetical protein [Nocardia harenae]|nr:hypothetical protein [Nocardia harenae]